MKKIYEIPIKKRISFLLAIGLILLISIILWVTRNRETIVNLGDGWKSYSHEEIGLTVKIPETAEAKFSRQGDKREVSVVEFSEGPIVDISSVARIIDPFLSLELEQDLKKTEEYLANNSGWSGDEESFSQERILYVKIEIDEEIGYLKFEEEKNKRGKHDFFVRSLRFNGKTAAHSIFFEPSYRRYSERFYQKYPELAEGGFNKEELEKRIKDHIKVIKDLVVSVDTF